MSDRALAAGYWAEEGALLLGVVIGVSVIGVAGRAGRRASRMVGFGVRRGARLVASVRWGD